ncbi:MAG: DoxX family protein [Planctomycetota bacterium]
MNALVSKAAKLHALEVRILEKLQSPLLLLIRLYWGWQFFQTGWGKIMNLERTAGFFATLGLPAPKLNALMAGGTEAFGGLLLLVGLGSRVVTIPLCFTMLVAYATAHRDAVKKIFEDPDGFVTQAPFLFLFASVIILVFGPGWLSADYLIGKKTAHDPERATRV